MADHDDEENGSTQGIASMAMIQTGSNAKAHHMNPSETHGSPGIVSDFFTEESQEQLRALEDQNQNIFSKKDRRELSYPENGFK